MKIIETENLTKSISGIKSRRVWPEVLRACFTGNMKKKLR